MFWDLNTGYKVLVLNDDDDKGKRLEECEGGDAIHIEGHR